MAQQNILTRADYKALQRDLRAAEDELKIVIERQGEVMGDEGEEGLIYDTMAARQELEDRIARIQHRLNNVVLADEVNDPDVINVGDRVTVRDMEEKEDLIFDIVGTPEAESKAIRVTISSPVGKALIGHRVKDKVEVTTPAGTVTYKILKIEPTPDDE